MDAQAEITRNRLRAVGAQRTLRSHRPTLAERVHAIKHFKHERCLHGDAASLATPRHANAPRCFQEVFYAPAAWQAVGWPTDRPIGNRRSC